jgi:hypothetical protein
MTTPKPKREPEPTHYALYDESGYRIVRALCGHRIRRTEHVNEPTCPACREELEYRNTQVGPV